jgi:TolB-like protein
MSFFAELKRRNVVRVGIAYIVIGWLLAQVAELAFDAFGAPDWVLKSILVVLLLGLPLILFIAWAFEITPEGVKLEKHVDRSKSITRRTGRKIDRIIIGVLVAAVGFLLLDKFLLEESPPIVDEIIATESPSIAVLPFVNMSDDKDHFADGLSEALLNLLAQIPDLKVAARTSSFAFKGRNEDLRQVGDVLGVRTVLEGSVQRSGERLRVTAQLINVDDGFHLWSNTYDRQMADIFDIQDEVAGAITDALQLHLAPASKRPTHSPEAYALYLEALAQLDSAAENYQDVIDLLDRAIRIDPQFARAYELKTSAYWIASGVFLESSRAQILIYEAATRAAELDPSLVLARTLTKTAHPETWSWDREFVALEDAMRVEPDNIRILIVWAYDLIMSGYFDEAVPVARRIRELDPLAPQGYWLAGDAYLALGRLADNRAADTALHDAGFEELAATRQAQTHFVAGEYDEGIAALGGWSIDGMSGQALREFIDEATHPESGLEFLRAWVDTKDAEAGTYFDRINAKVWYLILGHLDDFWREIEENTPESPSSWTNSESLEFFGVILHAGGFRKHPKYIPYVEKYGMLDVWDTRGAPNYCNKTDGQWACE